MLFKSTGEFKGSHTIKGEKNYPFPFMKTPVLSWS